jgi:hypothetical protein
MLLLAPATEAEAANDLPWSVWEHPRTNAARNPALVIVARFNCKRDALAFIQAAAT